MTQAKKLLAKSPVFVDVVAVLVNPTSAQVDEIISDLPIQWLQFHGEESPEFCSQFKNRILRLSRQHLHRPLSIGLPSIRMRLLFF